MANSLTSSVSLRELLVFFYKYRIRLLLAFAIPFALCVLASTVPVPRYTASSTLIVRLGSEYVYQPEVSATESGTGQGIPFEAGQIFKSEVAILNSDDLHEEVIKTIGIERLFPELIHPNGFALHLANAKHDVKAKLQSYGLMAPTPVMSDEEKQQHLAAEAVILFDKQLDILLQKESAVISLSFQHSDSAVAVQVLETLLNLYFDKRQQLYMQPRAELAQSQMDATRQRAEDAAHAVEEYKLSHKIYSLADQRTALLQARNDLQKQSSTLVNSGIEKQISNYSRQLDELDAQERQFDNLQREAQIANDSYSLYSHKLDEAKAFEELQRERASSVRVIQQPFAPPEPKKLQTLIIFGGVLLAFLCTLFVAALTEFTKTGFLTPERLAQNLDLPVLAAMPLRKRRLF